MPKWVDRVSVKGENGFEGPHEDGYNWRKYGQKDILRSKYPRCEGFPFLIYQFSMLI